jgi:hypothetical protein
VSFPVKIGIAISENTPVFYANHFEVGHSKTEFMLNVARFPPKPTMRQMAEIEEGGAFIIEPEVQILFAPEVARSLVEVLQQQIESYESNIAKIRS